VDRGLKTGKNLWAFFTDDPLSLYAHLLSTQKQLGMFWDHWGAKGEEGRNWPP